MLTPASLFTLGFDATFGCLFLLEQVQGDVAQNSKVLRTVTPADAAVVFIKGDIQDPMEFIFNPPMSSDRRQVRFGPAG